MAYKRPKRKLNLYEPPKEPYCFGILERAYRILKKKKRPWKVSAIKKFPKIFDGDCMNA